MGKSDRSPPLSQTVDASSLIETSAVLEQPNPDPPPGSPPAEARPSTGEPDGVPLRRIGRYVLLRLLGQGGMGVVYAAYDEHLERKVAVKLLHASNQADGDQRLRIVREAQALARVSAPNVVQVYEVGEIDNYMFIAMEFVNGTTLTRWQSAQERGWQETLRMYIAAGQGLWSAHLAGLTHRDFKPDNVLVGSDGRPRVADFGLARLDEGSSGQAGADPQSTWDPGGSDLMTTPLAALTQTGVALGTPLYMSPEQYLGQRADGRSDQFSFCVALYEALYGYLPFAGNTLATLRHNMIAGKVQLRPSDSQVPMPVHRALLRGLSSAPEQRFPSMQDLLAAVSFDEARDPAAAPGARLSIAVGLITLSAISTGIEQKARSVGADTRLLLAGLGMGVFLCFALLVLSFRRLLLSNVFHRMTIVSGLVLAILIVGLRAAGFMMGLSHSQIRINDLVASAAVTFLLAATTLPKIWPLFPLTIAGVFWGIRRPAYAPALAQVLVSMTIVAATILWSRAAQTKSMTGPGSPES